MARRRLGNVSLAIAAAILVGAFVFQCMGVPRVLEWGFMGVSLIGALLGAIGLTQKGQNKPVAALGCLLNLLIVVSLESMLTTG